MEDAQVPKHERIHKGVTRPREGVSERGSAESGHSQQSKEVLYRPREGNVYSIEEARARKEARQAVERAYESDSGEQERQERFHAKHQEEYADLKQEIVDLEETIAEYARAPLLKKVWHYIFDRRQLNEQWNKKVKRLRILENRAEKGDEGV